MGRPLVLAVLVLGVLAAAAAPALSSETSQTLVLPLRTIGVSDTTAVVVGDLLQGEIESHGLAVVPASRLPADLPAGEAACDDAACAAEMGGRHGASRVVYGSLSRLGGKVILRIRALRIGAASPYYAEQITATSEEDLDAVVRRVADGIVTGRSNADQATIDTVTDEETLVPRRRASRSGFGPRAGFMFPAAGSYGDTERMTSLRLTHLYETRKFLVESTPLLGLAWRSDTLEWTILDIFGARIFGVGDFTPYVGAGLGVHSVHVEKMGTATSRFDGNIYSYPTSQSQTETTLTGDIGVGLLALRTYDFVVVVEVRYHYVFADFDRLGGDGAHGIALTFGTSR
jgi:hypothetical protein